MGSGDTASTLLLTQMRDLSAVLATAEYTVSCQSGNAMVHTKERLSSYNEAVKYAVFDIGQNPENQELKNSKFDVLIAFNVSGTVEHPDLALSNARKLLKDGGELLLVEITNPGICLSLLDRIAVSR